MRAKLIVLLAAWLLSGFVWAQDYFVGPPLGKEPRPRGRPTDRTTDSPEKVHFGMDFSATQTPLAPAKNASRREDSRHAAVDRPADNPVQAGVTNGYTSRSTDEPLQGKWLGNTEPGR